MSLLVLAQFLSKRFNEEVEKAEPRLTGQVQYDNAPFTQPGVDKFWAKADVRPEDPFRVSIGDNPRLRTPGLLVVSIMGPVDVGDKGMLEVVKVVVDAFNSLSADGVVYRVPAPKIIGKTSDGWWQVNVNCPFYFDEIL